MIERSLCSQRLAVGNTQGHGVDCYRTFVENSVVGFFRATPEGRILMANPALLQMFGYSSLEDLTVSSRGDDGFSALHRKPGFRTMLERDGSVAGLEVRCRKRDGTFLWIRECARAIRGADGKVLCYDGTVEDISSRKSAEEAAQRDCKEKAALLHELQHRIKNSMATIVGLINMEQERWEENDVRAMLQTIGDRVRSIASLYTMLHASGSTNLVYLDEYLERITCTLMGAHLSGQSRVTSDVTAQAIVCSTRQAVPIGLIANELITNALKHAFPLGREGHVSVTLHQEGSAAVLCVTDDGVGLPEGFDLGQSNGLGTELVRMLVEQLRGSLSCACFGTTVFRVVIPLAAGEAAASG